MYVHQLKVKDILNCILVAKLHKWYIWFCRFCQVFFVTILLTGVRPPIFDRNILSEATEILKRSRFIINYYILSEGFQCAFDVIYQHHTYYSWLNRENINVQKFPSPTEKIGNLIWFRRRICIFVKKSKIVNKTPSMKSRQENKNNFPHKMELWNLLQTGAKFYTPY